VFVNQGKGASKNRIEARQKACAWLYFGVVMPLLHGHTTNAFRVPKANRAMGTEMKKLIIGLAFVLASSMAFAQEGAGGAAAGAGGATGAAVSATNKVLIVFGIAAVVALAATNDSTSTTTHH